MARGTRGSGARNNRGNNTLTRAEKIKKYGLATFHPDPEENRKLQETKGKDIDFTGEYTNSDGSQVKKSKFLPDSKTAGSTDKKKLQTRKSNIKPRLGYPLARGPGEMTGDTLLIKCLEYVAPQNGTGLGIGFDKTTQKVTQGGVLNGRKYKTGDTYTKYSNFRLNANDANSRMSRNQKIKYYVELPIPQEVNDSNIVTWGDDTMNIFQLAGVAAATAVMENPNKSFQNVLDVLQGDIQIDGLSPDLQKAIRAGFSGAAINALGGNVNRAGLIARATGQVLNSNLELLFGGVNLRTFPFSITFTPRYYEEMLEVKKIIRQFKMAMAAKAGQMNGGSASGIFLQSPDVFSLRYMHNGQDHPFLNSFKMCALTGMNVNYTNAGAYASYEDGTPVSIRMNLTFKELNPIYSEDYDGMGDDQGVGF